MVSIPFRKMHGLGNDFVVLDRRSWPLDLSPDLLRALADRHTGIGCDQVIVMEPAATADADLGLRFFNADGSESGACGNGTRCAASLVLAETGRRTIRMQGPAGMLEATIEDGLVSVDMGEPRLSWQDVPLSEAVDTLAVDLDQPGLGTATCCSMGNPHATFFVADPATLDLGRIGPALERHPIFATGANIGFAAVESRERLSLRVWERGAGATLACGSGACAALVAAVRRGLTSGEVEIAMTLGSLFGTWREDGHVVLAGPVATSFTGTYEIGDAAAFASPV
jgi:diaminopimelate epimerase